MERRAFSIVYFLRIDEATGLVVEALKPREEGTSLEVCEDLQELI